MEHKRSTAAPIAIAVLLLLPVLYVGSYLALLDPQESPDHSGLGVMRIRRYGILDGNLIDNFYRPANWVDEKIRPSYWNHESTLEGADW
jgi:hypothetical protein